MADGYKPIRLRAQTYQDLQDLKKRIAELGMRNVPHALQMNVETLSDVVEFAIRATRKAIG